MKYGLDTKKIYRLQICCEKLVYEMLAHCYGEDGRKRIVITL